MSAPAFAELLPLPTSMPSPSSDGARSFAPGAMLADTYRIEKLLAQGGMSDIYEATHLRLARPVAIKVLNAEYAAKDDWRARFGREAAILGKLRHPNVVDVIDVGEARGGAPYMVMELIRGVDLHAAVSSGRRFSPSEIASIVRQIASALSAAHALGMVHRDLKAENVVLCEAPGQPAVIKVVDFGISLWGEGPRLTAEHCVFGTPEYMAPEQAQGQIEQIDGRTDEFSLAVLAFTLLAGRTPFTAESPLAILFQIVHGAPVALAPLEGWDATRCEEVLRRGMAASRDDRYPTVLAFAEALDRALQDAGVLAAPAATSAAGARSVPSATTVKMARPRALRRLLAATAVAATLIAPSLPLGKRPAPFSQVREKVLSGWTQLAEGVGSFARVAQAR
jgi:serine/threonine-protein kinase